MNNVEIISAQNLTEEDKKIKENLSSKYFDNAKPSFIRKMNFTTPEGNKCTCFINKEPTSLLGSMVITCINGVSTEQFVHGMPKLHYWMEYLDNPEDYPDNISLYEKLDGTNICLYRLYHPVDNTILELVPKTRNMPILNNEFQEYYEKIDTQNINEFLLKNTNVHSLIFELWGDLNMHGICYTNKPDLNLSILCYYTSDLILSYNDFGFKHPKLLGEIKNKDNTYTSKFLNDCENTHLDTGLSFQSDNLRYVLEDIEDYFENLNKEYQELNDSYCLEGVILHTILNDSFVLMKLKPPSIKEAHILSNGIPSHSIKKEVFKFFEEFGKMEASSIINSDDMSQALDFIQDNLLEEYSEKYVYLSKTESMINDVLLKVNESKSINPKLLKIAREIVEKNPDKTPNQLMRIFAQEYPQFKKQSREMYNALNEIKKD